MGRVIIDVRERDEYASEHIEHSINVPLSSFASVAPGVLKAVEDREITFICHSGMRSAQALKLAKGLGYQNEHTYDSYEGGLLEWKKQGNSVVASNEKKSVVLPINRQVQLVVGAIIVVCAVLGAMVNPIWSYVAAAMGAGLFFTGATGNCAMGKVLAMMPWNKAAME